jgi:spoIIIJ-associated protein
MNTTRNRQPIRIEAKSVEQALTLACVKLNLAKEDLEYKIIKEPKPGLVSFFMGAKAEIEVWQRTTRSHRSERKGAEHGRDSSRPNGRPTDHKDRRQNMRASGKDRHERKSPERAPREERAPAEPLTPETQAQLERDINLFCKELCERIVGETVDVSSTMEEGKLKLEVDNAAVASIIQSNTKFVESLEHLLRKRPRYLKQELPFRIFIDAQGSRKGREEELIRIAKEKADEVVATGQKCVLDYKSAADRKIIHMALENDTRVYTKSIGNGSSRKLMILLSRGRRPDNKVEETLEANN